MQSDATELAEPGFVYYQPCGNKSFPYNSEDEDERNIQ